MAGQYSEYLANELNDMILRNSAWTPPTSVWIGLFTADTGLRASTPSAEVTGGSYARLEVGGASGRSFTISASGVSSNNEEWQFPQATATWGLLSHVAIMDASSGGNCLAYGPLTATKQIDTNDVARFLAGEFDFTQ